MNSDIKAYNNFQSPADAEICNLLYEVISENMPEAENKIWHAHPVWFLDGRSNGIIKTLSSEKVFWKD